MSSVQNNAPREETKFPDVAAPGIFLAEKPVGPSSFALVQQFRAVARPLRPAKPPKICHGGTLDPFASGLLLILVEPANRLFDYLHDIPKTYTATVRWGIETDNGDPLGRETYRGDPSGLSKIALDDALASFLGWCDQVPHATSAKRIDGERAYERAHRGEAVELPPSRVYLHEARWIDHDLRHTSRLAITVRGGFYVRALARDLGRRIGCGAHLSELRRTAIGPWDLSAANRHVHGRGLLPWLESRGLSDQEIGDLRAGRAVSRGTLSPAEWSPPAGFPAAKPLVRGFHLGKLVYLLSPDEQNLAAAVELRGGV